MRRLRVRLESDAQLHVGDAVEEEVHLRQGDATQRARPECLRRHVAGRLGQTPRPHDHAGRLSREPLDAGDLRHSFRFEIRRKGQTHAAVSVSMDGVKLQGREFPPVRRRSRPKAELHLTPLSPVTVHSVSFSGASGSGP